MACMSSAMVSSRRRMSSLRACNSLRRNSISGTIPGSVDSTVSSPKATVVPSTSFGRRSAICSASSCRASSDMAYLTSVPVRRMRR